jgi:hypothetical protein
LASGWVAKRFGVMFLRSDPIHTHGVIVFYASGAVSIGGFTGWVNTKRAPSL